MNWKTLYRCGFICSLLFIAGIVLDIIVGNVTGGGCFGITPDRGGPIRRIPGKPPPRALPPRSVEPSQPDHSASGLFCIVCSPSPGEPSRRRIGPGRFSHGFCRLYLQQYGAFDARPEPEILSRRVRLRKPDAGCGR